MKSNEFKCDCCGYVGKKRPESEAKAEQIKNGWGNMNKEDMAIVCDNCFKKIMIHFN